MGLFDGLNLADAKDNPFETPTDWYTFRSIKAEVKPNKGGDKLGLNITWEIQGGDYAGNTMLTWNRVPKVDDPEGKEKEDTKSWLKMYLLQLGFPENTHDHLEPEDFLNILAEGMCHMENGFTKPSFRTDKDEFKLLENPSEYAVVSGEPVAGSDDGMSVFAGKE
jgi:hypothetical protein